jgi:dipeptidyl aminopeptidase/acylaminoacyl peptidase
MNPSEVTFHSDSDKIAGYLFTPNDWKAGDPPRPGILVLAGYSGNTQADCTHMMKRLCAEGWFVFGYDYVGFGKSDGKRNRHRPLEQAQNTYDALTYMQTVPGIDPERLAIYGTSFGCANGIWVTAHDERVKCLVTSVGVTDGYEWMRSIRRPWEWLAFKDRVLKEAQKRVVSGEGTLVPNGEIMLRDPESQRQRDMHAQAGHTFQSEERDIESAEAVMRYRPDWVVDKISPRPVLMIYAEHDNLVPPAQQLSAYEKCGEPKKLVMLPKSGHYDSYEFRNTVTCQITYTETIAWFKQYL